MTDFLSGLVNRALNRVPVLQPRRPSIFEPTPETTRPVPSLGSLWQHRKKETNLDLESAEMWEHREAPELPAPFPAPLTWDREPRPPIPEDQQSGFYLSPKSAAPLGSPDMGANQRFRRDMTAHSLKEQTSQAVAAAAPSRVIETAMEVERDDHETERHLHKDESATRRRTAPSRVIKTTMDIKENDHEIEQHSLENESVSRRKMATRPPRFAVEKEADSSQLFPQEQSAVGPRIKVDRANETRSQQPTAHEASPVTVKPVISTTQPMFPLPDRLAQSSVVQPLFSRSAHPALPSFSRQQITVRETPQSPPTIQVTIGRIEVRGTTQAAAPARDTRPSSPRLKLEDYLRSRSGAK